MKALQNLAFSEVVGKLPDGREQKLEGNYTDFVRQVANHVPQGGLNAGEMRKRMRLLDAIEGVAVDAVVRFEDSDATVLQQCTKTMPWGLVAKSIITFCDAVENMKAPEPDASDEPEASANENAEGK